MSTITEIQGSDSVASSRTVINTNLQNLNTDKVEKVGTPVDNQIGVWTGDGTIEGDAALTFDTTSDTLTVTGASPTLNLIATDNSELEVFTQSDATYMKLEDRGTTNVGPYFELYKNSATPAANDDVGTIYFVGEDSAGNKQNYAHVQGIIADTTSTSEDGKLAFAVTTAGTLANELELTGAELYPTTNDGLGLGNATNQFSDLFLAEGAVINWDNGDVTLTQTGNQLEVAGGDLKIGTLTGVLRADTGVVSVDTDVTDIVTSASDTAPGKVELATIAETNTGTDATRAVTPDALAGSYAGTKTVCVQISGSASGDTALAIGDDKATLAIDTTLNGMNLVALKAYVTTVSSSGAPLFQVRRSRRSTATARTVVDMLTTGVSIDANEFESADATAAVSINTSNDDVQTGDILLFDCDTAGTGTKGATLLLTFQLP